MVTEGELLVYLPLKGTQQVCFSVSFAQRRVLSTEKLPRVTFILMVLLYYQFNFSKSKSAR